MHIPVVITTTCKVDCKIKLRKILVKEEKMKNLSKKLVMSCFGAVFSVALLCGSPAYAAENTDITEETVLLDEASSTDAKAEDAAASDETASKEVKPEEKAKAIGEGIVYEKNTKTISISEPVQEPVLKDETAAKPAPGLSVYNGVDYSDVYDYYYYINKYADLKKAFGDDQEKTLRHFITYGMKEGRIASENFNVYSYMKSYPDLRNAFRNNNEKYYEHYLKYGKKEGRKTVGEANLIRPTTSYNGLNYKDVYDYEYYVSHYADLRKVIGTYNDYGLIEHFVKYGMNERRRGNSTFDVSSYAMEYKDLRKAFGTEYKKYYEHYIKYGKKEGRRTSGCKSIKDPVTSKDGVDYSKVYDFNYYIANNKDIANQYACNDISALDHFINQGMKQQRKGNAKFDVVSYIYAYKDLRNAFKTDYPKYYMHYIQYGAREGRVTSGVTSMRGYETKHILGDYAALFDYNFYVTKYGDIKNAFGTDEDAVLNHFVKYGLKEGRMGKASYDNNLYNEKKALSNDLYKPNYKNGWLKYKGTWYRYDGKGNIYTVQTNAPTLVSIPGYYVSPMKTGNLNSREERIEAMISRAYDYMGTQYRICKSTQPGGAADCSGLVMQCLYAGGFNPYPATPAHHALPQNEYDSRTLFNQTPMQHVSYNNRRRGDLIYYRSARGNIIIHVAIYLGNGRVIESWPPRVTDKYSVAGGPHPYIYGATRPFP